MSDRRSLQGLIAKGVIFISFQLNKFGAEWEGSFGVLECRQVRLFWGKLEPIRTHEIYIHSPEFERLIV